MIRALAFEGPNRSGKGTQIEILSSYLEDEGIPYLVIRGDGSRTASGEPGNPKSLWWNEANKRLHSPEATLDDWDEAANRLAKELISWRYLHLPDVLKRLDKPLGYLLIDRSVISRYMVRISQGKFSFDGENLYPGLDISLDRIIPDKIFLFLASKNVLLSRLDKEDPKYQFRKSVIDEKGDWYERFYPCCDLGYRLILIDATESKSKISRTILENI